MLSAILWGLVQGLTEFLPVSSSGHTALVPALFGVPPPGLAVSAVLHLGTLVAVLAYYWRDLARMARLRTDPAARRLVGLIGLGTVPAAVGGLAFEEPLSVLFASPRSVAVALVGTGLILLAAALLPRGERRLEEVRWADAILIGLAQALALLPGISRSGATISAGLGRRMRGDEAARFSFLLAIPAIAGAGGLELTRLLQEGSTAGPFLAVGVAVAALSGYLAIAVLIRALLRYGPTPFALYCLVAGSAAYLMLG